MDRQQINKNIGGSYIYSSFAGNKAQLISLTINRQDAINPIEESLNNSTFAAMANYSITKIDSRTSFNFGVNYFDISVYESAIRQVGLNAGYTYRNDNDLFSIRGGSMISIDDTLLNSHFTFRYRKIMTNNLSMELSSRIRHNQRISGNDRLMVRSDLRIVMSL